MKKFSYFTVSETNRYASISVLIKPQSSVSILFHIGKRKYILPLTVSVYEKYKLIEVIEKTIEDKKERELCLIETKKGNSFYIEYFPIYISYDYDKYIVSINHNNEILRFGVDNLSELLSSLKEDMIFPGDRFIGLEAIHILPKEKERLYWKAKCLLCGREVDVPTNCMKRNTSCGCLNGRNFNSVEDRFLFYVDKQENIPKEKQIRGTLGIDEEPCWMWTGNRDKDGYGNFLADKRNMRSHRYSWEIHNNKRLDNPSIFVCHRCDNPTCVNPTHLFEGTNLDNMRDRDNKRRNNHIFGEMVLNSKLNNKKVLEIRKRVSAGEKQNDLAKEYGVSCTTICNTIKRKIWNNIDV